MLKNLEMAEDCQSVAGFSEYITDYKDATLGLTIAQATEGRDMRSSQSKLRDVDTADISGIVGILVDWENRLFHAAGDQ